MLRKYPPLLPVIARAMPRAIAGTRRLEPSDPSHGKSLQIEKLPATDAEGYAGLADEIDYHTWSLVKGIVLSMLLNVGSELTLGGDESNLLRALRRSSQQSVESAGDLIVCRELGIRPTITVRSGWPLRIIVHQDLMLEPYEG